MPSATTAESSDSTAPSSAMVNAAPINPGIWWKVTAGSAGAGRAALVTPNRLPMVATGKWRSCTAARRQRARLERRHGRPPHPVALHDRAGDDDKGARGPADLPGRAAQRGDVNPGDDGGEQPALGADPARDRERDGERERNDA